MLQNKRTNYTALTHLRCEYLLSIRTNYTTFTHLRPAFKFDLSEESGARPLFVVGVERGVVARVEVLRERSDVELVRLSENGNKKNCNFRQGGTCTHDYTQRNTRQLDSPEE